MELFKLFGKIAIDNTEANKDIDETTEKASDSSDSMVDSFRKIGGAVAAYLAVDKVVSFGQTCIEQAAAVQAQTAQFEAAFGDLGGAAQEMFASVGGETGILSTRLQTEGTKAFSMFKGAGMDAGAALEETETFMRLAADAAAYYDISLEEASERVLGFAKGNFENGDAIGVFTNEAQRNAIAMEQYGQKYADCTEAQKQMMALDMISNTYEMSGALGQASREADGYENVTGNLKESWRQFQAVLGAPILQAVIPLIKSLTSGIADFTEKTKAAIQWMQEHQTLMTIIAVLVGTLTAAIVAYNISLHAAAIATAVTTAATTAFGAVIGFLTSPVTLVVAAIGALVAIGVLLYKNWDTIKVKALEVWGAISGWFASVWEGIKAAFSAFVNWFKDNWDTLLLFLMNPLAGVFKYLYENFDGFREKVDTIIQAVKNFFVGLWSHVVTIFENIKNAITVAIMFIGSIFQAAFQIITLPFRLIWENCKQYVFAAFEWIKNIITTAFTAIGNFFSTIWGYISSIFMSSLNAIRNVVSSAFNAIKSRVSSVLNAIKNTITTVWNAIKSVISRVLNAIKNTVSNIWNAIKNAISTALNAVKNTVSNIFNGIKNTVSNIFNGIKNTISNVVNSVKTTVTNAFNIVKSKIETPINKAKETVKNAVDAIKGFFDGLKIKFPDIKLPHFGFDGTFSISPPSVPKFTIDWYAKAMHNPMLLNDPTIFGYNPETSQFMGAGEAGAEVVAGANPLMNMIGGVVAAQNGGIVYYLQRIMQILAEFFPQVLEAVDMEVSVDGAIVARKLAPHMDKEFAKIQKSKERGGSK